MATINGTSGNDLLNGTSDLDFIRGFAGADTLNGGANFDRAIYDDSNAAVVVILGGNNSGSGAGGSADGDVLNSIENVTGSAFNDTIIGDEFDNFIDGGGGFDTLKGAGGDDFLRGSGVLEGDEGNDSLRGGFSNDTLRGGTDDDVLDGREGADAMDGGAGIDTIVYDASDVGVTVFLTAGGTGGDAEGDTYAGIKNIDGSSENDQLAGDEFANRIDGSSGDDLLKGGGGADTLEGSIGNDTLEGGNGDDLLFGGFGADAFRGEAGIDTVSYIDSDAGIFVDLGANTGSGGDAQGDTFSGIEVVEGSFKGDTIQGDAGNNRFFGDIGDDVLKGFGGSDTLLGDIGNDQLFGGDGDDKMDGGSGADTMFGGAGNDVYAADTTDTVNESAFGGTGIDTVFTRSDFSLSSSKVIGDVENLTLLGTANLNAVGNALANTITGNAGVNNINGNSGADLMRGMGGGDHYVVNEAGDVVDESLAGSGGVDDILSFVSFDLSGPKAKGSVENLRLALGTANLNAHGNALGNELVGNNGVNVITGAAGNDKLTGFGGNDFFVFTTALNALNNVDTIEDFNVPQDTMRLENTFFTGLANGVLAAGAFRIGAAAADASDRVIYNDDTGAMFFDRDGTGAAAAVRFATLDANLAMTNADIFVI